MSEIPMYPDECEHGLRDFACPACLLADRVFALETVLKDIRKAGRLTPWLAAEIDMLIEPTEQSGTEKTSGNG